MENTLYYGDNLDVLRRYIKEESVDLIYLDPPFNSNATYNVLFAERNGTRAAAQIQAFEDTWQWDQAAAATYQETVEAGGKVSEALQGFCKILGASNMLAYLAMMAPRLVELRRVLKPTGSIYLHCDPTASHYLKVLMDAVFGPEYFQNEIVWKRKTGRGETSHKSNHFGTSTDILLFYTKSGANTFNSQFNSEAAGYSDYVDKFFCYTDADGRKYAIDNLASPSPRPNLTYEYKGYPPPKNGWAISKEKMELWDKEGRLHFPENPKGRIRRKRYLDELQGKPVQNLWDDIEMISSQAAERLGYPTQKPEALLERIIKASSNEGDLVLDPFCGCGTAVASAQKLGRAWIGIDITHLAINLIKIRLKDAFEDQVHYQVIGEPTTTQDAEDLAASDPYQFQWWALGLVGARPAEGKKGADQGVDGRLYFHDDPKGSTKQVVFSVKAGGVQAGHIRDLEGVLDREHAQIGVLLCMHEPTRPMRSAAASAGVYTSLWSNHPRIQILTVAELLVGKKIDMPPVGHSNVTFKKAERHVKTGKQSSFMDEDKNTDLNKTD